MSEERAIRYPSLAETFQEEQLPTGENRYWVVYELKNGMIGTWADYADTPDEFIINLFKRQSSHHISEFLELQMEVKGWPATGNVNIDFAKYVPMLKAAQLMGEERVYTEVTSTFDSEDDLQLVLRASIDQLDPTLRIIDGGKERETDAGRIDITAMDGDGKIVVIELKSKIAPPKAIAQALAYMTAVIETDNTPVRGMLVAADFHKWAILAARRIPDLQLKKYSFQLNEYSFQFSFELVR